MLPSRGHFSTIPCVFYVSTGCTRPHCHYRHSISDYNTHKSLLNREEKGRPLSVAQIDLVSKLVEQSVDDVIKNGSIDQLDKTNVLNKALTKVLTDTEVIRLASETKSHLPLSAIRPYYLPTPISRLNNSFSLTSAQEQNLQKYEPLNKHQESLKNNQIKFEKFKPIEMHSTIQSQTENEQLYSSPNDFVKKPRVMADVNKPLTLFTSQNNLPVLQSQTQCESFNKPLSPNGISNVYLSESPKQSSPNGSPSYKTGMHPFQSDQEVAVSPLNTIQIQRSAINKGINSVDVEQDKSFNGNYSKNQNSIGVIKNYKDNLQKDAIGNQFACGYSNDTAISRSVGYVRQNDDKNSTVNRDECKESLSNIATNVTNMLTTSLQNEDFKNCEAIPCTVDNTANNLLNNKDDTEPNSVESVIRWLTMKSKLRTNQSKMKIPHVPNVKKILEAKQGILEGHPTNPKPQQNTIDQEKSTIKLVERQARTHNPLLPLPQRFEQNTIPLVLRQKYCIAFFNEFIKNMNADDARVNAIKEEFRIAQNSQIFNVYRNSCSLFIMKYRRPEGSSTHVNLLEENSSRLTPSSCPDFTHGWSLYKCFSSYLLKTDQLRENGYPLQHPDFPDRVLVVQNYQKYTDLQPKNPFVKICANCYQEYEIDEQGIPRSNVKCEYHWGKLRKIRFMGQWMKNYSCCNGLVDSSPCESGRYHVYQGKTDDCMSDYIRAKPLPSYLDASSAGIYAIDCEMCYTTRGLELARLTVVNVNEETVFDEVVNLNCPVLDYCTRFSGINEEKLRRATYTFEDIQQWILKHFYDKTILVGHSLENDLKALKFIHENVIDTSITFPYKFGSPSCKLSLKNLAHNILKINIQDDVNGHDSKEDAITCIKLMMLKIRDDSKQRKPRIIIGYIGNKK